MPMKTYRWGILGAGRIADKFCEALNFTEGSEVFAVASRDANNAKAFAQKHNAKKYYTNYNDLITDADVDVIYIATPHAFHYQQTLLCLQHNKPVLCEKPLSLNYKLSADMVAVAAAQQTFLMEGLWTRFMPFTEKILQLIANDVIGTPQCIHADFGFAAPFEPTGRMYNKALGGGSVLDIGVYPIFLATLILGEPSAIKAFVTISKTGVDETANILLQYPNGATAQLLSTIAFDTPIEAEIIGTKGRIKIDAPWFKATDFSVILIDGSVKKISMPHQLNGFEHEIKEVMYCLNNGLLQSAKMPHQLTLQISKIMDAVLAEMV